AVNVKEGATVKAGQTLLRLDAEILENNIAELETALDLATTVYKKQARLWDKQIGTEVQYLQAKNNKESLERRLATAQSQRNQAYVKAPFSGVVDLVNIKQGEMASMGMPLLRIVNMGEMHILADVPERYLSGVKAGDSVEVLFPSLDREIASTVTAVGQVINPLNRTFTVEVDLPANDRDYKPNMTAVLKVKDYESPEALIVPSGIIQKDNIGDYLYKVTENENTLEARKVHITLGKTYGGTTEITEGLASGDKLVNEGYREVTDGVKVSKAEKTTL
ncbi:MAG: efflux RND transporter periplasmic adaptor subunit, partial [Cyclobacteriaceae bacterium]